MNPNAWYPNCYEALGPVGRAILPLHVGRGLPPVVALVCYFDESFDEQIHVVGGYLADVDLWDRVFAPKWNEIIANAPHPITEFKASDCRNGRREFASPGTKKERDQITIELVSVIRDTPLYAGVSGERGGKAGSSWESQTG